jgi:predicted nucleic acid-binding Zn ribbon protein
MFRKEVKSVGELILRNLREQGLETPLQQKRLIAAWPEVMGEMIAGYTQHLFIKNQTLFVHLSNPALRADLSMMRLEIVKKLNAAVCSLVIADIRFN